MKWFAIAVAGLATSVCPSDKPLAMPAVTVAGIRWEGSIDLAKQRAAREHEPILLLQMFGRLDDEFC
jgi:hypothetical protein